MVKIVRFVQWDGGKAPLSQMLASVRNWPIYAYRDWLKSTQSCLSTTAEIDHGKSLG